MSPTNNIEYVDADNTASYTHKKFNYGYTHKKFGLRLMQRDQDQLNTNQLNKVAESITLQYVSHSTADNTISNKKAKDIFRPYALDESNTPRKRKTTLVHNESTKMTYYPVNEAVQHTSMTTYSTSIYNNPYTQQQPVQHHPVSSQQLQFNKQTFTLMLQKQRAALQMRNLIVSSNVNFWPTNLNQPTLMGGMC